MHVIQVFMRYDLGNRFLMSDDFGNAVMIRDEPVKEDIDYSMLRGDVGNNNIEMKEEMSNKIEFNNIEIDNMV